MTADFTEFNYDHDGLRLYGRLYGELAERLPPFVCLAGLTRNARDFHDFALAIRRGPVRRPVVAFDYRGRGRSDRAGSASRYTITAEMADVVAGLAHLGITRAVFVGTSRGALIVHLIAVQHPNLIAGAVLNDAGPKLEIDGLLAIRRYVGRLGTMPDWDAASEAVRRINQPTFPALGTADFRRMARANFIETGTGVVADYDPRLAETLAGVSRDTPLPEMWEAFDALRSVPALVIRGENSMLLASETVERMRSHHPGLETVEVRGQGHAPLLETAGLPERIAAFASRIA